MNLINLLKLILCIAIAEAAGLIGTIFTEPAIGSWYATLARPEFAPPNWIFAPVWTTLYLLMGIAAFLVWQKGLEKKEVKIALSVFGVQLILNTLWSIIFFGLQSPGWAFVEIVFLWLAIGAAIVAFAKISKVAAWLLVPYILWVSFAAYLNFMIFWLN
jgi:tryptophan-rich sensory protein